MKNPIHDFTTSDNYTAISEATTDDSYAGKKRKRARRHKPRRMFQASLSPYEPPESIIPLQDRPPTPRPFVLGPVPGFRSRSSSSQLAVGSLPGPPQSAFTFTAPTDQIPSSQVPQPDNAGLIPGWTEWSPDPIPVWTEGIAADKIAVPQGLEDLLARGEKVDWDA